MPDFTSSDLPIELVTMRCPSCGPGLVPLSSITFRINLETNAPTMAFQCAMCARRASLPLSRVSVEKLIGAGIEPDYWQFPDELRERAELTADGTAPFSYRSVRRVAAGLIEEITAFLSDVGPSGHRSSARSWIEILRPPTWSTRAPFPRSPDNGRGRDHR
ncbi:MAG: hypothetical protein JJE46_10455, partial [Acidimicrobiia bacterium]|nr:hypothetical protein [Acidimicrobiia bacterium]